MEERKTKTIAFSSQSIEGLKEKLNRIPNIISTSMTTVQENVIVVIVTYNLD